MTPQQMYVDALLDSIANEPFPSEDQRELLLAVKERLATASDLGDELRRLYAVDRFADFALSLLWVQKQCDSDPERSEPTADDQYFVSLKFRQAFAEERGHGPAPEHQEAESIVENEPPQEEAPPAAVTEERSPVTYAADAAEDTFPQLLEKFVIAVQAGVDDKTRLFDKVVQLATDIGQPDSEYSSDLQEFCARLVEFLSYVRSNEYMDDVRTMNILSTISDAMASWSSASIETRSGLLSEGIKALSEAQSHFE
jgi:hypothetical protein